jgi:hypothetical protein
VKLQIRGGAGAYEAAAIAAAIAHITDEQAAAAVSRRTRNQQSAWVAALWAERELDGEDPNLPAD